MVCLGRKEWSGLKSHSKKFKNFLEVWVDKLNKVTYKRKYEEDTDTQDRQEARHEEEFDLQ
jgi:hypothetical protein